MNEFDLDPETADCGLEVLRQHGQCLAGGRDFLNGRRLFLGCRRYGLRFPIGQFGLFANIFHRCHYLLAAAGHLLGRRGNFPHLFRLSMPVIK